MVAAWVWQGHNATRMATSGLTTNIELPTVDRISPDSGEALEPVAAFGAAPVCGQVAAGIWLDDGDWVDNGEDFTVPFSPIIYPSVPRQAWRVRGDSMDRVGIVDGCYVITIDYGVARLDIRDGDLVVVERRQSSRTERTVKTVRVDGDRYVLEPRSTNPRWTSITIPRNGEAHVSDEEIRIVGLVVGVHHDLQRR